MNVPLEKPPAQPAGNDARGTGAARELHQRAEAILQARAGNLPAARSAGSAADLAQALHELQVQQIELELQNEELRRIQTELAAAQALHLDFYNSSPLGYLMISEPGLLIEVNPTAATLLGAPRRQLLHQPIVRLIHPDDQPVYQAHRRLLAASAVPQMCELRLVRADGSHWWARLDSASARDVDGQEICHVMLSDITRSKQAEAALRESELRMSFALETCHIGAWDLDLVQHTAYRSLDHDRIFGYHELLPEWTYEMFLDHVLAEDRAAVDAAFQQAIQSGGSWNFECRIRHADGALRWIWASGRHARDATGTTLRMAGIVQDITERKQAEAENRELNQSLDQRVRERTAQLETTIRELDAFSYSVSHDLRTPLRAVDGFSRILIHEFSSRLDPEGLRILGVIRNETQRMGKLIDDLLAFSRLGRQLIQVDRIAMRAMAQAVFDELATLEPDRNLQLRIAPLPPARGTPALIRQVWTNLIGNAIKFTKERELATILIDSHTGEDGWPVYSVQDNGAGFDMRFVDQLFGVFQRLHTQQEFPGTGVGLALVQRIVLRHGGRVWAQGEVNRGATFAFSLGPAGG